uniref:Putative secreted protein n=1 Tax=Ixodes ricinus TaxID=34613 RepID=A0A6B0UNR0_IXORI
MTWFCAAILGLVAAAFDQRLVVVGLVPNCNLFDDFLVELDDKTRKRLCQHLQEVPVGVLVGGPVSRIYDGTGQVVQNTCRVGFKIIASQSVNKVKPATIKQGIIVKSQPALQLLNTYGCCL